MGGVMLGAEGSRNKPVARYRDTLNSFHVLSQSLLPVLEIDGAGKRRHDNELSEGQFRLFGKRRGGGKGVLAVGGEAEDKRSEHMNVMLFEFAQAVGQLRPGGIEIFVNGLQAFLGNCFNPHQARLEGDRKST